MKKQIFFTLILLAATAYITVKYFKTLSLTGVHVGNVMRNIPEDASAVLEFTNEKSFYDIFAGNTVLGSVIGDQQLQDLNTVKKAFETDALKDLFDGAHVYISIHAAQNEGVELLLTAAALKEINTDIVANIIKQPRKGILITPLKTNGKDGFTLYFPSLKKRFFVAQKDGNIYSGSFSKDLIGKALAYKPQKDKRTFLLLPDQQNLNSLANLYINYEQLDPLFNRLFKNKNSDLFKSFRLLPALAALNLNYKTDALMFNGYTEIKKNQPESYLNLFAEQQPVINKLKDIFPSTTAYAINLSVSDPVRFTLSLSEFHNKAGLKSEKEKLYSQIKTETGISINPEFNHLLGNEFAVVTTRYQEKLAIISVKNGLKLRPFMINISTMLNDNIGQFNYNKLPFYLLGDAFNAFRKPYFRIADNYLVLANSVKELDTYEDTYLYRKFLNESQQYNRFDNLLARQSNVSIMINFKNSKNILKAGLNDEFYNAYQNYSSSWKNFYAASYQFTASDKNFYTNFCMLQNDADTLSRKKMLKKPY